MILTSDECKQLLYRRRDASHILESTECKSAKGNKNGTSSRPKIWGTQVIDTYARNTVSKCLSVSSVDCFSDRAMSQKKRKEENVQLIASNVLLVAIS